MSGESVEAFAVCFVIGASIALWILPDSGVQWRSKDMKRWQSWRDWFQL